MKSFRLAICGGLALLFMVCAAPCRGEVLWAPVSYGELVTQSDLIVVGKIQQVANGVHESGALSCSRLEVREVLKGTVPSGGVRLDFPCANPVVLEGEAPPQSSPLDVFFCEGQDGIWFLKRPEEGGHFIANHPSRFKPVLFLSRVRDEIRKAPAH